MLKSVYMYVDNTKISPQWQLSLNQNDLKDWKRLTKQHFCKMSACRTESERMQNSQYQSEDVVK